MTIKNRPLIRWAGSKTRILHLLTEHSPKSYGRYIEPFCGSMSLFLRISPEKASMGDINEELINFYRQVKIRPVEISEAIHSIPRTEEEYYKLRAIDISSFSELEKAIRFFFLNRHCFNGVYRTNKSGAFNVPFGSKLTEIPSRSEIIEFSKKIARTEFICGDFEKTISSATKGDFIYLDPPYAGTESRDRGEYGLNSFKELDIARLSRTLKSASEKGAKVLLSYASIEHIKTEFSGWNIREISVERSVSGFARGRRKVPEVIITNY
ncbi:Dam family site-specific DNA-(adenine-N6)-methyltransferase [Pseudomonas cerasi]|uniref:Dam family site-specific DNA-(adenine-N6)-methyltransferase n=1 Tax=Pseudomonas cerasi TaxID=1583341 RepID=UPI00165548A0|nr:Dam family site-specific DNA-(adenine-N6)-methyltransferase [Pseudomonas cerasi]